MSIVALAGPMVAGSAAGHSSTREIVDLAVTEEQLHCPKVFRALIDQRRLGAAHMPNSACAQLCRVQVYSARGCSGRAATSARARHSLWPYSDLRNAISWPS